MVFSKGALLYSGPVSEAYGYFQRLVRALSLTYTDRNFAQGFVKPEKKTLPEFYSELSGAPEQFYRGPSVPSAPYVPTSPVHFGASATQSEQAHESHALDLLGSLLA